VNLKSSSKRELGKRKETEECFGTKKKTSLQLPDIDNGWVFDRAPHPWKKDDRRKKRPLGKDV